MTKAQKRKRSKLIMKKAWETRRAKLAMEPAPSPSEIATMERSPFPSATATSRSNADEWFEIAERIKYLEARGFKVTKA